MKTILTIAAIALSTTAVTAKTAAPAAPAVGEVTTAAAATIAPAASNKRLCVLEDHTGSRLPVKTCKTAAEWDALGVKYRFKR